MAALFPQLEQPGSHRCSGSYLPLSAPSLTAGFAGPHRDSRIPGARQAQQIKIRTSQGYGPSPAGPAPLTRMSNSNEMRDDTLEIPVTYE